MKRETNSMSMIQAYDWGFSQYGMTPEKHTSTGWFGLVLWYINPCWLFNAKSSLYKY